MKKKLVSVILAISFILVSITVAFASVENLSHNEDLSFQNGSVHCFFEMDESNSFISLTTKLYRNGRLIRTWNSSGFDYLYFNETYPAVSGSTYQLSFACNVDGTQVNIPSITKVCP